METLYGMMAEMAQKRIEAARAAEEEDSRGETKVHKLREENRRMEARFLEKTELLSEEGIFFPFGYLLQMFHFGRLELHCFLMAWYGKMYVTGEGRLDGNGVDAEFLWHSFPYDLSLGEFYAEMEAMRKRPYLGLFFRKEGGFLQTRCCLAERSFRFLHGRYDLEGEGYRFFPAEKAAQTAFYGEEEVLSSLGREISVGMETRWGTDGEGECYVVLVSGEKGTGRHTLVECLAARLGLDLLFLPLDGRDVDWEDYFLTLRLHALCPVLEAAGEWEEAEGTEAVRRILSAYRRWCGEKLLLPVLFVLTGECLADRIYEETDAGGKNVHVLPAELEKYPAAVQRDIWRFEGAAYPSFRENLAEFMAERFCLTTGQIKRILRQAEELRNRRNMAGMTEKLLKTVCCSILNQSMGKKAVRIEADWNMEDLVLPTYQKKLLNDACAQVKNRSRVFSEWGFSEKMAYGRGISMIFAGPPGTGKTMAALVMANQIGMDIYRVNLPAVVSKYIGETEKNLEEIFEHAAKSQVILFFDEADVLFSKRTEVKEANDKYNNMEAAFLLQKMEQHEGVVILATNFLQNFDDAFRRRVRFIIDFPFPSKNERTQIWQRVFPDALEKEELDFEFLGEEFELSGSSIRNTALSAAFLAAAEQKKLSMKHVVEALKQEYAKNGKILGKEELKEYAV